MSSARKRLIAIIGLLAVVALVVVGVVIGQVRDRMNTMHLTAHFASASGVFVDNIVAVLGMPVGRVKEVNPKNGYVEVKFTVDGNVKIPKDVEAVTLQTAILTDRQIELTPAYTGGETLRSGDTIDMSRTHVPVEFNEVLETLDRLAASLAGNPDGTGPVYDVVNNTAAVVEGNGEKIKSALGELSTALRLSADRGGQTKEQTQTIVKNVDSLVSAAADNDTLLREFGSSVRQLTDILADEDLGSGTTGRKINSVLTQAAEIIANNREHIRAIVDNGGVVADTAVFRKREMAEFLDVLPLTLENVYNAIDRENGNLRIRLMTDRVLFETQHIKEMCNILRLRQLGCSTGTIADFGPDFGLTYVLDGLATMGQK